MFSLSSSPSRVFFAISLTKLFKALHIVFLLQNRQDVIFPTALIQNKNGKHIVIIMSKRQKVCRVVGVVIDPAAWKVLTRG